jgi:hypothetical protein
MVCEHTSQLSAKSTVATDLSCNEPSIANHSLSLFLCILHTAIFFSQKSFPASIARWDAYGHGSFSAACPGGFGLSSLRVLSATMVLCGAIVKLDSSEP